MAKELGAAYTVNARQEDPAAAIKALGGTAGYGPPYNNATGFSASANVDLIAIYLTGLGTILLLAIPFIPGLRDIPRWIPVHRLIWRNWEPAHADTGSRPSPAVVTPAAPPPVAEPPNPT